MMGLFYICLHLDIRWVPINNYVKENDTLVYDSGGHRVGRLNRNDGYIIGKVILNDDFYAAYRKKLYSDNDHQFEVKSQKILPQIDGILPKGPYPPCLRMTDRALWQDTLEIQDALAISKWVCFVLLCLCWNKWSYWIKVIQLRILQ